MSDLAERLRAALARGGGRPISDHEDVPIELSAAAVLIAITDRPAPGVLLTLRQRHLRRHAGQVAFPGGRVDPEDVDSIASALREAEEEIGLPPSCVEVVGTSDRYRTGTGFDILPVIGVVPPDLLLVPHEPEVADIFEVPLAFLLDAANHGRGRIRHEGRWRGFYEILWLDRRIWGVTAGIIVNLAGRLGAPA